MTDPLESTVSDGGLNSSDTQDWNPRRDGVRIPWYLTTGVLIMIGGVVFLIVIIAIKLGGMFQAKPAAVAGSPPPAAVSAPAPVDKDAEIAALRNQLALLQTQTAGPASAPPVYTADPAAIAALSARLDRVEANQRAFAHAAMVASAAEDLEAAARSGAPFINQLAVVEPGVDDPNMLAPLRPYADKGVPTAVDLAVRFPRAAAAANIASRDDSNDNSLLSKTAHALGSILHLSIRRTDNPGGQGTQAILQNASNSLSSGDLRTAVADLDALKPAAHKAIEPWLADAKARLLVDDATQRISAGALSRLAQVNAPAAATPGAAL